MLVFYQQLATSPPQPAYAFLVSKKISSKSVVRHAVKRKLADAVAPFLPRLPQNIQLVFLAKQKAAAATRRELQAEVEAILHRARLL